MPISRIIDLALVDALAVIITAGTVVFAHAAGRTGRRRWVVGAALLAMLACLFWADIFDWAESGTAMRWRRVVSLGVAAHIYVVMPLLAMRDRRRARP